MSIVYSCFVQSLGLSGVLKPLAGGPGLPPLFVYAAATTTQQQTVGYQIGGLTSPQTAPSGLQMTPPSPCDWQKQECPFSRIYSYNTVTNPCDPDMCNRLHSHGLFSLFHSVILNVSSFIYQLYSDNEFLQPILNILLQYP